MKRIIDVLLGDGPQIGTLRYDLLGRRESAAFEYGAGWLSDPERVRELKTWISEDAGSDMTIDALISVIAYFRITNGRAKEILSEVAYSVESWRRTGQSIGMTDEELEPFADAFEHAQLNAAKKLI